MGKIPLFLIIIVVIIAVTASFRFVQQRRENSANQHAPRLQLRVAVSSKHQKVLNDRRSHQQMTVPAGSTIRYEASFTPLTGEAEMAFRLNESQYRALTVGDKGTLTHQGTQFIDFSPE